MADYPVLLIADHKWRDLPGMALIKTLLEEVHGLPALIVSYAAVGACLRIFRPRALVLTTMLSYREQNMARAAHTMNAGVAVIPTEGGMAASEEDMAGMFRHAQAWRECDVYLAWGPLMAEFAVARGYLPSTKVQVTGCGRFDFYLSPLRELLLRENNLRARYGLRSDSAIMTWATSFVMSGYLDDERRLRFNERDFLQRGLASMPGYANLRELAGQEREARTAAMQWMRRACLEFPQVEFLIKPHPYEPFEPYEKLVSQCRMDGLTNVRLTTQDYMWSLLDCATLHLHSASTTGFEAWLMGVPTINVRPGGYFRFKESKGGALSELDWLDDNCEDAQTFLTRVGFYLGGGQVEGEVKTRRSAFLERWFFHPDGRAAERQAAAIAEMVKGRPHRPHVRPPLVGRRTPFNLLHYRLNMLLGLEFDRPWFGSGGGSVVDFLGQRDKVVRQKDVVHWVEKNRAIWKSGVVGKLAEPQLRQ